MWVSSTRLRLRMVLLVCLILWVWSGGMAMAASAEASGSTRELDQTPTWSVAAVCTVFILISITLEMSLHKVGTWLGQRHKKALIEALEKVKSELMIMGFISLLLTFGQTYILRICISSKVADRMLPCPLDGTNDVSSSEEAHRRKLLSSERRFLAASSSSSYCKQIRGWKAWEAETSSHDYEFSNDPSRFRLTHDTSFVKAHASFWTGNLLFFYIGCFFRQFYRSVGKADYLALRNGFITVHLAPRSQFNFQKYIKRSLEDDFKIVVGVSPVLWASFVVFLLLNVDGWRTMIWASLLPVAIIMAVGTKLQAILAKMALEITERHAVVQGIPLVQGSDKYFWFGRPQLVLHLIHFALFQNAFQITYFLWIWYSFGLKNCFHADYKLAILKVALGSAVLCLCSYITLPLYALVTQMGSSMKTSVFDEQTSKALKKWRDAVKRKGGAKAPTNNNDTQRNGSSSASLLPATKLRRFKTTGHSGPSWTHEDVEADDPLSSSPISLKTSFSIRVERDNELVGASKDQPHG
ncbi:MLO-like protein 8 isoform X2 [Prosopis cineraria]|uniref:MLO-like protein 8 isoform X2 n=1 Tax=Prosopis cineraria TaxID=364024 RepID=UPI00240F31AC|nr:MLO-like protein 8 isoform X2 [Prosopis cineraria]